MLGQKGKKSKHKLNKHLHIYRSYVSCTASIQPIALVAPADQRLLLLLLLLRTYLGRAGALTRFAVAIYLGRVGALTRSDPERTRRGLSGRSRCLSVFLTSKEGLPPPLDPFRPVDAAAAAPFPLAFAFPFPPFSDAAAAAAAAVGSSGSRSSGGSKAWGVACRMAASCGADITPFP